MVKLIVFDWDDVFTMGSTNAYYACYHETLRQLGVKLAPEEEEKRIKARWGSTVEEEFGSLLKEEPQLIGKAVRIYEDLLMGDLFVSHLSIVPGGADFIKSLSSQYKIAIASGVNPRLLKEKIFTKFDIPNVFSAIKTVYDLDDPSHAKPHPYLILEILKELKIAPGEAAMVGDAPGDMKMAMSADVTPIAVLTGHLNRKQAEELGVKYVADDVTKILPILKRI